MHVRPTGNPFQSFHVEPNVGRLLIAAGIAEEVPAVIANLNKIWGPVVWTVIKDDFGQINLQAKCGMCNKVERFASSKGDADKQAIFNCLDHQGQTVPADVLALYKSLWKDRLKAERPKFYGKK